MCVKLNQTFEFIKKKKIISTVAQYRIKISCGTESIKKHLSTYSERNVVSS